jgi:serine/threonine-protein kinase
MFAPSRRLSLLGIGFVVALAVVGASAAPARAAFAVIAYSESTGQYGYVYGYDNLQDAENDAIANCGADDAFVAVEVENGWAALALGDDGAYGDAWSTSSLDEAENLALGYAGGGDAYIAQWVASGS